MASVYKQQLLDWVAQLDVKADTVVDIGGSQDPIKGRTKSWDVNNYLIYDLDSPHYTKQPPDKIYDLQKSHWGNDVEADMVFCLEVFDYIRDPILAFENIRRLMVGEAWISFPFLYPHHNPIDQEGLRYTEPAIRYYGERFSMPVKEIIYRRANSMKLLEYYSEDGFRSAKEYDHGVIGYIVRFSV